MKGRLEDKCSIWPNSCGTFDLFGIDANSYPNTYLLNKLDVERSPIISTHELHVLTYEIFADGFSKLIVKINLDLRREKSHLDTGMQYSPSGYPTSTTIIHAGSPASVILDALQDDERQSQELLDYSSSPVITIGNSLGTQTKS